MFVIQLSVHGCTKTNDISYMNFCIQCNKQSARMVYLLYMCDITDLMTDTQLSPMGKMYLSPATLHPVEIMPERNLGKVNK